MLLLARYAIQKLFLIYYSTCRFFSLESDYVEIFLLELWRGVVGHDFTEKTLLEL